MGDLENEQGHGGGILIPKDGILPRTVSFLLLNQLFANSLVILAEGIGAFLEVSLSGVELLVKVVVVFQGLFIGQKAIEELTGFLNLFLVITPY